MNCDLFTACFKGIYPYFNLFSLLVIITLLIRRQWKKEYSLLLVIWGLSFLGIILQMYIADGILTISRRYVLPYAPVLFGFAAAGVYKLEQHIPKFITAVLAVILVVFLYMDAGAPSRKDYRTTRRRVGQQELSHIATLVNMQTADTAPLPGRPLHCYIYSFPAYSVIANAPILLTYWAKCENIDGTRTADYIITSRGRTHYDLQSDIQPAPGDRLLYSGSYYQLYKTRSNPAGQTNE